MGSILNFKNWFEAKWHEFEDTVTLYHGTSSAFLDDIKQNGIQLPGEELMQFAMRNAQSYFPNQDVPQEVQVNIKKHALSFRGDTNSVTVGNVIYLTPDFDGASDYANSYYKFGGEIAYDVWQWSNLWYCKQQGKDGEICIQPIHENAKPLVVEVEVPYDWMTTYNDLRKMFQGIQQHWEDEKDWYVKRGKTFEDYLKSSGAFEVRITKPIPKNMITKIHPALAKHTKN